MNVETVYLKINKIIKPIDKLSPKTPPVSFKIHHFLHDIFTGKNAHSTCQLFELELHIESRGSMADRHDEDPPTTPVLAIQSSCLKLQQLYLIAIQGQFRNRIALAFEDGSNMHIRCKKLSHTTTLVIVAVVRATFNHKLQFFAFKKRYTL